MRTICPLLSAAPIDHVVLFRQVRLLGGNMNAILTAAVIGTALLALAIWIEIRERRAELGDGSYRSSGRPRS